MSLFNGIKWPYATMQQLNLDWLLDKVRKLTDFLPDNGSAGDLLVRSEDGAAWEAPEDALDDVLNDTGWIDIPETSLHYRKKNGYVTVAFDSTAAVSYRGTADWEVVATLPAGFRPSSYIFFLIGAGGHSSDYRGTAYIDSAGSIGIYFDTPCTNIAGFVIFPV